MISDLRQKAAKIKDPINDQRSLKAALRQRNFDSFVNGTPVLCLRF